MKQYFEVVLNYKKEVEAQDGRVKKVSERYLIDALTFTEAEKRMATKIEKMGQGQNPFIKDIKRSNITEIVSSDGSYWFKAKVVITMIDEEAGRNKKGNAYYLVAGDDLEEAQANLKIELDKYVITVNVESITETKIVDVYPYEKQAPDGFKPVKK